jgi:hypothetical protein
MSKQLTVSQLIKLLERLPKDAPIHCDTDEFNTEITGVKVRSQLNDKGEIVELVSVGHYE